MKTSKISVIIASYNGQEFIAEAIESINKQTYPVKEIIVVDDGSTDKTEEIVKNQNGNIRFIKQQHKGDPAFGRNIGIGEAKGELIAFLDQDDMWPENKLEIQVERLERFAEAQVDVGTTKLLISETVDKNSAFANRLKDSGQYFLLSSGVFRKSVFEEMGLFAEDMTYHASDFDWIVRAAENEVLFSVHGQPTHLYRIHDNNYSNDIKKLRMGVAEVFKNSLFRRKLAGKGMFKGFPKLKTIKS